MRKILSMLRGHCCWIGSSCAAQSSIPPTFWRSPAQSFLSGTWLSLLVTAASCTRSPR
ncbi:unnamed protein product [Symbiodinium pilosum]|uniref:Uncharacterized protein n=1 Tax=Symbiodinium pilosum TaxID=2952 RepID=A0A812KN61_SYMPI|nr:unnamed protein product [Symbiodinium pilosum]